ncbi:uncharacterized protein LOC110240248 [Exaiptasia diaphana]|uniref:Creatinase N-terminal domain-containing protein n=1 Tax=Exaiptasia diaphana TaxID=2652724 RepID=A0A913XC17_EXADI|nr:uncharacterized protein LOC110240248 [Exaiptasia diaphana]
MFCLRAGVRGVLGSARLACRSISVGQREVELPRTLRIKNGEKVKPTFTAAEMERRLTMLRTDMENRGIDACVLTSYHNINYFSDFLYCYFGRPYALVVTADKSTSVSAGIDYGQPGRRTYGENVVYTDWQKDNYFFAINQLVGNSRNVGFEYNHLNLDHMEKFKQVFPNASFVDVGDSTMRMRMIKSDEEIEHIKQGAAVCDFGAESVLNLIREGVPEHEVAMASTAVMVREIARRFPHAELMDTWSWFQTGINTDGAHNPVTS